MNMPRIDWGWLADGAGFKDEREMWHEKYLIQEIGSIKLGEYLGVSHMSVLYRLKNLGYKIHPQGGANNTVSPRQGTIRYQIWQDREKIKDKTIPEIQGMYGLGYNTVLSVLFCLELPYKRRKNKYQKIVDL